MYKQKMLADCSSLTADSDSVLSIFESRTSRIHTTHSWEFLGINNLEQNYQPLMDTSDVIVGVIDTGKSCIPLCLFTTL